MDTLADLLLVDRAMQDEPALPNKISERDLDEVLLSLEADLFGPPKRAREREDSTQIHVLPPRTP